MVMVQNLMKSPLVWSIGGVGAIAIALIGLSYLGQGGSVTPELTLNNLAISPWQLGKELGWQAAVAAQTAQTQAEWKLPNLWQLGKPIPRANKIEIHGTQPFQVSSSPVR